VVRLTHAGSARPARWRHRPTARRAVPASASLSLLPAMWVAVVNPNDPGPGGGPAPSPSTRCPGDTRSVHYRSRPVTPTIGWEKTWRMCAEACP